MRPFWSVPNANFGIGKRLEIPNSTALEVDSSFAEWSVLIIPPSVPLLGIGTKLTRTTNLPVFGHEAKPVGVGANSDVSALS